MTSLIQIVLLILDVVWFIAIVHIILSWLINFQVLNLRQPIVAQIWDGLNRLLEPIYRPIRRVLPDLGGIDLAPLVLLIGIYALRIIIANNAGLLIGGF
jgi:YggT family protein